MVDLPPEGARAACAEPGGQTVLEVLHRPVHLVRFQTNKILRIQEDVWATATPKEPMILQAIQSLSVWPHLQFVKPDATDEECLQVLADASLQEFLSKA